MLSLKKITFTSIMVSYVLTFPSVVQAQLIKIADNGFTSNYIDFNTVTNGIPIYYESEYIEKDEQTGRTLFHVRTHNAIRCRASTITSRNIYLYVWEGRILNREVNGESEVLKPRPQTFLGAEFFTICGHEPGSRY